MDTIRDHARALLALCDRADREAAERERADALAVRNEELAGELEAAEAALQASGEEIERLQAILAAHTCEPDAPQPPEVPENPPGEPPTDPPEPTPDPNPETPEETPEAPAPEASGARTIEPAGERERSRLVYEGGVGFLPAGTVHVGAHAGGDAQHGQGLGMVARSEEHGFVVTTKMAPARGGKDAPLARTAYEVLGPDRPAAEVTQRGQSRLRFHVPGGGLAPWGPAGGDTRQRPGQPGLALRLVLPNGDVWAEAEYRGERDESTLDGEVWVYDVGANDPRDDLAGFVTPKTGIGEVHTVDLSPLPMGLRAVPTEWHRVVYAGPSRTAEIVAQAEASGVVTLPPGVTRIDPTALPPCTIRGVGAGVGAVDVFRASGPVSELVIIGDGEAAPLPFGGWGDGLTARDEPSRNAKDTPSGPITIEGVRVVHTLGNGLCVLDMDADPPNTAHGVKMGAVSRFRLVDSVIEGAPDDGLNLFGVGWQYKVKGEARVSEDRRGLTLWEPDPEAEGEASGGEASGARGGSTMRPVSRVAAPMRKLADWHALRERQGETRAAANLRLRVRVPYPGFPEGRLLVGAQATRADAPDKPAGAFALFWADAPMRDHDDDARRVGYGVNAGGRLTLYAPLPDGTPEAPLPEALEATFWVIGMHSNDSPELGGCEFRECGRNPATYTNSVGVPTMGPRLVRGGGLLAEGGAGFDGFDAADWNDSTGRFDYEVKAGFVGRGLDVRGARKPSGKAAKVNSEEPGSEFDMGLVTEVGARFTDCAGTGVTVAGYASRVTLVAPVFTRVHGKPAGASHGATLVVRDPVYVECESETVAYKTGTSAASPDGYVSMSGVIVQRASGD